MKDRTRIGKIFMMCALIPACAGQIWAAAPQAVSPGSVDQVVEISDNCPTFSWGAEPDRSYYEIVAYVLDEQLAIADLQEGDLGEWNEVLYTTVPGSATSWTPAIEQRLEPGDRYVWFVRGVSVGADGELLEAGEWSKGKFFAIPDQPTEQQLQQALELVQRYLVAQGTSNAAIDRPSAGGRSTHVQRAEESDSDDSTPPLRSIGSAPAAIRGMLPDTSGESYGVVGASDSAEGAGLAAVNTAGGPDLVLDGSEDSLATDTELRESGISRSSPTDEIFSFWNPGAGDLTLDVAGNLDAVDITAVGVFTGDGSGLTGISYTETDPVFLASDAAGVTVTLTTNWNTAFAWGDHGAEGYLTDFTEADPVFIASDAAGVTVTLTTAWNTAFAWGDHSTEGYLTDFTETDPVFVAAPAHGITAFNIAEWTAAYLWGNHAIVGYDPSADAWAGTAAYSSTTAMVGVGMAGAPTTMLHVLTDSSPGVPQVMIDEAGSGDAFEHFTLSGTPVDFSTGIDAADQNFKITGTGVLTDGVGSSQGDGITVMQANPQGIVDFDNQSRARAILAYHPQNVPFGLWTPLEFDTDMPPYGFDQQGEFTLYPTPGIGGIFSPKVAGYYQINARTEFLCEETPLALDGGYVSIAIYVNGVSMSEGSNHQVVYGSGGSAMVLIQNNAPNVSDVLFLSAGDTVEIKVIQTVDGSGLGLPVVWNPATPGKTYVSFHKLS